VSSDARPRRITFVGAGNMASAIIGGLINDGVNPSSITAADPSAQAREMLSGLGVTDLHENPRDAVGNADVVVLAVKPQIMAEVLRGLRGAFTPGTTVISIAAGISIAMLEDWIDSSDVHVVRCMPNTPALVRCGASGLYANKSVGERERHYADVTMACVGTTLWVDSEAKLDAVTAVSGSGPAYFFAFMEAMIQSGERLGLSHDEAAELTLQTALGAARLASEQNIPIATLRRNVTSPGGTTEQALQAFQAERLDRVVGKAMDACHQRAEQMAKEFK